MTIKWGRRESQASAKDNMRHAGRSQWSAMVRGAAWSHSVL